MQRIQSETVFYNNYMTGGALVGLFVLSKRTTEHPAGVRLMV